MEQSGISPSHRECKAQGANNKKEILKRVNKIIKDEGGIKLKQDSFLKQSELDSFGFTFFYYSLIEEFSLEDSQKEFFDFINNIDYEKFKVKDLIEELERCIKQELHIN